MTERIPTFCGKDCGGNACPLLAVVTDGVVTGLERNPAGLDIKPCPRGYKLAELHYSPQRLLHPLVANGPRGSGRFRRASWDEALELVARRLSEIRCRAGSTHGASTRGASTSVGSRDTGSSTSPGPGGGDAILNLGSAGSTGALHDSQNLLSRFLNATGGAVRLSGNYSNGAARFVLPYLFGSAAARSGWDAATVRHSRLIVLWGANILEARLGAELGTSIAQAARAGTPVIVIDPRRSRTARALGARWIPVRPGTDVAMMLATLHVLFRDGQVDRSRASSLATGMAELEAYVTGSSDGVPKSPVWAAAICGLEASVIEDFAREYAAAHPAMLVPGYSIQRVLNGEESYRLSVALQIASGNFGIAGGSTGSLNNCLPFLRQGSLPDLEDSLPLSNPRVPVLRWANAILEGRSGGYPCDIRAAYIAGFNALNQGADCTMSIRAMRALDFSVCHELFLTPTARFSDVVLPVLSPLEKADLCAPWLGNYLLYKRAAVAPRGEARSDYDIFNELSERMGHGTAFSGGLSEQGWLDRFKAEFAASIGPGTAGSSDGDSPGISGAASLWTDGVYFGPDRERVGLADFAADPLRNPLPTPSGKVEILSRAYAEDTGRTAIPQWTYPPADPRYPFLLVTPKTIRRTHSQGGDTGGPDAGELSISGYDARRLGLTEGEAVVVYNDRGRLLARAVPTEDIAPGVLALHEGVWLDLGDDGLDRGPSANMLTSSEGTGPAVAPVMHGIAVNIHRGGA